MLLVPNGGPIYRGMRNRLGYDEKQWLVLLEAYLRRETQLPDGTWLKKDLKGVSVSSSKEAVFLELDPKAIAELDSNTVRTIKHRSAQDSLEIHADPPTADSNHGNIVHIPYLSDDPVAAEFFAGELARCSTLVSKVEFRELRAISRTSNPSD